MIYPLDEPHLAALRWACTLTAIDADALRRFTAFPPPDVIRVPEDETRLLACRALSTPSAAAQLVRDLLGACGVTTCSMV